MTVWWEITEDVSTHINSLKLFVIVEFFFVAVMSACVCTGSTALEGVFAGVKCVCTPLLLCIHRNMQIIYWSQLH